MTETEAVARGEKMVGTRRKQEADRADVVKAGRAASSARAAGKIKRAKGSGDWTASEFKIATVSGTLTVKGYVWGAFGIDLRDPDNWVLTHLPTGRAVRSRLDELDLAMEIARRLDPIADWNNLPLNATSSNVLRDRAQAVLDAVYRERGGGLEPLAAMF